MTNAQQIEFASIIRKTITRAALDLQNKIMRESIVSINGKAVKGRHGWNAWSIKAESELEELRAEIARLDSVIDELEASA